MFAPVQLLHNWREQRPNNMGDLEPRVTEEVGRVYYREVYLLLIPLLYISTWYLMGCVLNGTLCINARTKKTRVTKPNERRCHLKQRNIWSNAKIPCSHWNVYGGGILSLKNAAYTMCREVEQPFVTAHTYHHPLVTGLGNILKVLKARRREESLE
jgi:hypothetical protein